MSDNTFSFVTSVFMIGGLVGSLFANKLLDRYGRKGCTRLNALLMTLGAATMALAQSVPFLVFGRFLIGVAAGVGLCTTPVYLDELSPPAIRGRVGVFNQLAVVIGILLIQGLGLLSAQRSQWRPVLWFSALLGVLQLVFSKFVVDTPVWLRSVGREGDASTVATRIWSMNKAHLDPTDDVVHRLLDEAEHSQPDSTPERELAQPPVSVAGAFTARELRQPLVIVAWIMFAQQVSGINAVMYYSNIIMARALPDAVQYISLGIAVVNAVMTLPAIILIEKMGRRGLLILSSTGVLASLLVVGYGIDAGKSVMSSVAITVFVGAFAIGLGPVPFVLIPEVSPFHGVSALSSIAISINWFINFFVGLLFLPLSHWLSDNNPYKEGRVFYLFAAVFFVSFVAFLRVYK
ncbi:general substrate transporter [Exidia glandulosa HHB12029]|uniref:General substrate transporter n=1 Tax=Exidia glandulosa HHB12029 TaxID=1314781 RepID=A0A165IYU2_EXIGL|nr:general substrate transporter [Exidia glandulosa HHB12029]